MNGMEEIEGGEFGGGEERCERINDVLMIVRRSPKPRNFLEAPQLYQGPPRPVIKTSSLVSSDEDIRLNMSIMDYWALQARLIVHYHSRDTDCLIYHYYAASTEYAHNLRNFHNTYKLHGY